VTRLFYVDESRDGRHHFHVGLLADGPSISAAEAALDEVVEDAYDNGVARWDSELHAKDIFDGNKAWERGSNAQRAAVFEEALSVIPQHGIEVLARGANLARFSSRYGGGDPYRWEFSNLLERLNERLHAVDDYGLVIADQQHEYRKLLQRDVATGKRSGTGGYRSQRLVRVLDTAHFVDSKLSRMIQLADLAAFVLRRRASIPTEHDARAERLMARLYGLVEDGVPSPTGQYHTIRW
jgi:Protein of unknown function (DUF3800)